VIPAAARRAAGIGVGDAVVVRAEPGRVVLETPGAVRARIRELMRGVRREPSVVDELIAERRADAGREAAPS